jgi:hypothetical protein
LILHQYSAVSGTSGVDIAQAERALGSSPAIDWREAEERSQVATSLDCKPSFRIIHRRRRPGRLSQTSLPPSAERDSLPLRSHFCLARKAKRSLGPSTRLPSHSLCALACRHCLSSTSLSTRVACWLDSCLLPTEKAMPWPRESLSKDARAQT